MNKVHLHTFTLFHIQQNTVRTMATFKTVNEKLKEKKPLSYIVMVLRVLPNTTNTTRLLLLECVCHNSFIHLVPVCRVYFIQNLITLHCKIICIALFLALYM